MTLRAVLDQTATIVVIGVGSVVLWRAVAPAEGRPVRSRAAPSAQAAPLPEGPVSLVGAAVVGAASAEIVILEFSDFQCPFCARFARDTWPQLVTQFVDTGRVQFAFRHFPLDNLHKVARQAAETAECARRQGRFRTFHDRLFEDTRSLTVAALVAHAEASGLPARELDECLATGAGDSVRADEASGKDLGVSGTPTFFIGTRSADGYMDVKERVVGAQDLATFERAIARAAKLAGQ